MEVEQKITISTQKFKKLVLSETKQLSPQPPRKELNLLWASTKMILERDGLLQEDSNGDQKLKREEKLQQQKKQIQETQLQAEANNKLIQDTLIALANRVNNTKKIESIGTQEITVQDAISLEYALQLIKTMNEMNKESLNQLKKIETVKSLGETVTRDSCSIAPSRHQMSLELN
ncbi:hypothetical protein EIN_380990 [Entamoeba invadens IP1]|uniref:Uncharacterized protein n=1 Tax=Entamoeba invadens IP1 TaxID=370355 RepID=A0A0A1UAQ4_ENTIV|nr:hypothetical protein EIN_380990 [Entamoeba invadens IP1]ELP92142.1 hypothetical protein EIN_380990 [Entamoeba invadens IP1]|eukprot:XP_004258913.1 hypothetical protein EIN_380990 [Entamoeba invadens IP1]